MNPRQLCAPPEQVPLHPTTARNAARLSTFDWKHATDSWEATMNRPAIHDLLGSVLCTWYASVAEWRPPGLLSSTTCVSCRSSILASALEIADWPHDLIHDLAVDLDAAAAAIHDSLEEDRILGRPSSGEKPAAWHVRQEFSAHINDVVDVLSECVAPRLDAWVAAETARAFAH
jgi:hypothetical protein